MIIKIEHRCDPIRPPAFQTTQRCGGFRLDHTINSRDAVSCGLHYPHLSRAVKYAATTPKQSVGGATQMPRSALESRCSRKVVSSSCAEQYARPGQRVLPHANVSAPRRGYTRKLAASQRVAVALEMFRADVAADCARRPSPKSRGVECIIRLPATPPHAHNLI